MYRATAIAGDYNITGTPNARLAVQRPDFNSMVRRQLGGVNNSRNPASKPPTTPAAKPPPWSFQPNPLDQPTTGGPLPPANTAPGGATPGQGTPGYGQSPWAMNPPVYPWMMNPMGGGWGQSGSLPWMQPGGMPPQLGGQLPPYNPTQPQWPSSMPGPAPTGTPSYPTSGISNSVPTSGYWGGSSWGQY
jgi:hypothetical protein